MLAEGDSGGQKHADAISGRRGEVAASARVLRASVTLSGVSASVSLCFPSQSHVQSHLQALAGLGNRDAVSRCVQKHR